MARILIGNIKGPTGDTGPQGEQGGIGPAGPQGPLAPLVNNALATEAGVAALDAAMGKTLQDQITQQNSNLAAIVKPLNTGTQTVTFTYNTFGVLFYARKSLDVKGLYFFDANSGITSVYADTNITISCTNKTVSVAFNNDTFRQGIFLSI